MKHRAPQPCRDRDRRRAAPNWHRGSLPILLAGALIVGLLPLASGCGGSSLEDALLRYRQSVEATVGLAGESSEGLGRGSLRFPRRRLRRIEVEDQRIGVFDFFDIVGCRLSEVVAARNSSLGRVLEPTRRLEHELEVIAAADSCLQSLDEERARRLAALVEAKRKALPTHVWNAVWLDADVERFLADGPRAFVGGVDPADAAWQLQQVAEHLGDVDLEDVSVSVLESAFGALRDDPAIGQMLRDLDSARRELGVVASLLDSRSSNRCDRTTQRLVRTFQREYLPLQTQISEVDRRAASLLESLDALYQASSARGVSTPGMRHFSQEVLDTRSGDGLWQRYRSAVLTHASAWDGPLRSCGVIEG